MLQAAVAACALLVPLAFGVGGAAAQQDDTLTRINRLEGEIDTLSRAVFKGQVPANFAAPASTSSEYQAAVEVRISGLENQVRDLTGKVEQQNFELSQIKEQLQRLQMQSAAVPSSPTGAGSTEMGDEKPVQLTPEGAQTGTLKPDDLGGNVAMPDPNAPAPANAPSAGVLGSMNEAPGGAVIPPQAGDDPAGQYEMAFSLLKGGNAMAARNGFEEFLRTYPNHPLAANATYWLGESYYAQNDFDKAARIFAESYKKFPKGPKVADSLLKLGMSLGSGGKKKEACVALKQLKKEFPAGEGVTLRRADQEMTRLGCDA